MALGEPSTCMTKTMSDMEDRDRPCETPQKVGFGKRHIQVALNFFGAFNLGVQFSSLSVALVGMTDTTSSAGPVLHYTLSDKGTISGLYIYGTMMGMIPAGYVVSMYKPMRLMCIVSGILAGGLHLLFPYAAVQYGFSVACTIRVLIGFTQAVRSSGLYAHLSRWIVSQEQEKFSFGWGGSPLGDAFILAMGCWRMAVNILLICVGIIWAIAGLIWGAESPDSHPSISSTEKAFIQNSMPVKHKVNIKWKKMFTSTPVWAFIITHACEHWTAITMSSLTPTFFDKVLRISVEEIGYITAGINMLTIIVSFGYAYLSNILKKYVSANFSRKLWNTIGLCGGAIPLFLLHNMKDEVLPIVLMIAAYNMLNIAKLPGHLSNNLDLAPSHSGIIASGAFFISNLVAFTGPIIAGFMIKEEWNPGEWWNVFALGALINVFGAVVFLAFGSTKKQEWDSSEE